MQSSMLTLSRQYANPKLNTIQLKVRGKIRFFSLFEKRQIEFQKYQKNCFFVRVQFLFKKRRMKKVIILI